MSGEFNIFNNLEEMMKSNFLAQIRTLDAANNSNDPPEDTQCIDDDFDEFDTLLNNNHVKSPSKRSNKKNFADEISEKKTKKNCDSRRSSTSKERSLSPPMPLLENMCSNLANVPVSGRTRRSMGKTKTLTDTTTDNSVVLDTVQKPTSSKRGRGGRGRGRGKGRAGNSINNRQPDESSQTNESSNSCSEAEYSQSLSIMEQFLERGRSSVSTRSQVMRNRRNYISEKAARCPTVDSIDLVNSPFPRVEGMISLDSDDDEVDVTKTTKNPDKTKSKHSLDISLEEDNPELSVKINWKGTPEAFKLRKYQKFMTIFKILADREDTNMERIVFNLNDRIISPDDTPGSIGYKIFQFINGRILPANSIGSPNVANGVVKKRRNPNEIRLKIQSDKWKRPLNIDLQKTDQFRILYIKCSEELNVAIGQIKLSFDGEQLELNDTPANLELEGGEAIDLRLKN